ncbi:MAG: hypothetical protein KGJ02_04535 [Verrucomicrobiota bacterium]|nr:hypothetical protein [Verrucomicrobiota bacterium]
MSNGMGRIAACVVGTVTVGYAYLQRDQIVAKTSQFADRITDYEKQTQVWHDSFPRDIPASKYEPRKG